MKMEICLFILPLSCLLLLTTANSDIRLVDGGGPCAGRVEVLHKRQWGTVCHNGWDMADAAVVCRQMFCGDAVTPTWNAHFGAGTGRIWMADVSCGGSESTLKNCEYSEWRTVFCNHGIDAGVICSGNFEMQLTGGPHLCSGRLKFKHGGSGYTVCDPDFDLQDAKVVCRQLGCGIPLEEPRGAAFGKGGGQVWSKKINCTGDESDFRQCLRSSTEEQNCTHETDVGLKCFWYTDSRLVGGPDSCSGRVELQYLNEWGTVCDASWDMRAASVLCRQLQCGSAVAVPGQAWFGEGRDHVWADVFECQGNETHLSQCAVSSWSRAACSHGRDAGLICEGSKSLSALNGTVRLSGESGCEGQVEVYYQLTWSRVLMDSWSFREASVVCRQLGCGSAVRLYSSSLSGTGDSDVCLTGYQCSGSESHLMNCSDPQRLNCSSGPQVSIECSKHRSIRLVGDAGGCAGRLEVLHQGSWGTVCGDSWDLKDAQVVCRQLQCGTVLGDPVPTFFGPGTGPIWLNEVDCKGTETSLWDCPSAPRGQNGCVRKEDVGVVCSEYKEIRLADGCSGQLEVFYNGTWGNVCFNQMDTNTASLICQHINCGKSEAVSNSWSRLKGAPNWLDNLKCRPHDSTLWQCPSSNWGDNKCDEGEVAQITCDGHPPMKLSGGSSECSGRVELWHNGSWGTVCDDSWDLRDAQVVCRRLGCGTALEAHGNSAFGRGTGTIWLNEVNCRGDELHLWDCPHSLQEQRSCSHKEDAGVTCAGSSLLKATTGIPATSTTTKKVPSPVVPSQKDPSIPFVVFLVLGALLFLLLVITAVQLYQNKVLKRALYQEGLTPLHEAIYEEIEYNLTRGETYRAPRKGSVLSEELPFGYEDVEDSEGDPLSEKSEREAKDGDDDAVITEKIADNLSGDLVIKDTPADYDDAGTVGQDSGHFFGSGLMVTGDTPEDYDDVEGIEQSLHVLPGERALTTLPPGDGLPEPDQTDYDDVGEEGLTVLPEEAPVQRFMKLFFK
ncbi:antigen WC1.1-like [Paramormyrops kingsleyae]|uniref:antigen WC1.1-like n=1 Tax=Paramormyrops kingsleyae TaxID=1676925 RepID=UPI003B97B064